MRLVPSFTSLGLALLLCTVASAQAPDDKSGPQPELTKAEMLQRAQGFVNEASQLYLQGDYEAALTSLRNAEPLAEKAKDPALPSIRFNIARCLEQLQRWPEALEAYQRYNRLPDEPHRKERAWDAMRTLRGKVFGTVSVACDPMGAQVTIEGLTKGAVACPWQTTQAKPGEYKVAVRHPGFLDETRTLTVLAGQSANVEVALKRDPASAPAAAVVTGPAPESKPVNVWPWVGIGAGAAALGLGGFFTAQAIGKRSDAEALPPGTARDDAVSSFESNRTLAYAMYGVGGALAAAGVVLFFVTGGEEDPEDEPAAWRVRPSADGLRVEF